MWAYDQVEQYVNIGYPKVAPFYTPAPRDDDGTRIEQGIVIPSDEDLQAGKQIKKGLERLRGIDRKGADILVEWYGAYPGAPNTRKQRMLRMGINSKYAKTIMLEKRAWVEGWITCFQEFHFSQPPIDAVHALGV